MQPVRYTTLPSPLGELLLTDHGHGLSRVAFLGQRHAPSPDADWRHDPEHLAPAVEQLTGYLAGERTSFELPLDLRGTDLQRAVWAELRACPYGTTTTYGAVARACGRPTATRAVAAAIGRNPVAIVVPCHRVIGADGKLTGYAGGLDRKAWLLRHEGALAPTLVAAPPR